MKRLIYKLSALMAAAAVVCGCDNTNFDSITPHTAEGTQDLGNRIETTFTMDISQISSTRALTTSDEQGIKNIYVYVFRIDGTGYENEHYAYTTRATGISVSSNTVTFSVQLRKSADANEKFRLVFVANLPELTMSTSNESLLAARARAQFEPSAAWASGTDYIPMTQETPNVIAVTSTTTASDFGNIYMLRSLAKVNIVNNDQNFNLESVKVFNAPNRVYVAPSGENYDSTNRTVTLPTPVSDAGTLDAFEVSTDEEDITNSIYIGEAAKRATVGDMHAVYMILKGSYDGGESTYYRIDFLSGEGAPIDILRNHIYTFTISNIGGAGMTSEVAAQGALPINSASTTITEWNETITDITTDGIYSLGVSTGSFAVGYLGTTALSFTYQTNYTGGVEVSTPVTDNYITFVQDTVAKNVTFNVSINDSSAARTGTIAIRAGRIVKNITVSQASFMSGGGRGTQAEPWLINTLDDLCQMRDAVNAGDTVGTVATRAGHYRLMADIDIGTVYNSTSGESWTPIGDTTSVFSGRFEGGGHTFANLYINKQSTGYQGLFGKVSDGVLSNINVTGSITCSNNTGSTYIGGIAAACDNATIINCSNSASVAGFTSVGGVVGAGSNGTKVINCYNRGVITGSQRVGGISGGASTTINNCYNTGAVTATGTNGCGAIVGIESLSVENCYYLAGSATSSTNAQFGIGTKDADYLADVAGQTTVLPEVVMNGTTPRLFITVNGIAYVNFVNMLSAGAYHYNTTGTPTVQALSWTQTTGEYPVFGTAAPASQPAADFSVEGTGTEADPYEIRTLFDLEYYQGKINASATNADYKSKSYKMMADIDMGTVYNSTTANSWSAIGLTYSNGFSGKFDGNGFKILNYYSTTGGLFGYLQSSAKISNLTIQGGSIQSSSDNVGAIANTAHSSTISNCSNSASVSGLNKVGGIIGNLDTSSSVINCSNSGTVTLATSGQHAGGIVGYNFASTATIINCFNSGAISGGLQLKGGIVGLISGTISNCFNVGSVEAGNYSGGIAGDTTISGYTLSNNYYIGNIGFGIGCTGTTRADVVGEITKLTEAVMNGTAHSSLFITVNNIAYIYFVNMLNAGAYLYNTTGTPTVQALSWTQTTGEYPVFGTAAPASQPAADFNEVGTGTAADPYEIWTLFDLEYYRNKINASATNADYKSKYYKVMADIALPSTNWAPIGTTTYQFTGNFDGGNHLISNLYYNGSSDVIGLFGQINAGSVVCNLHVDCNISTSGKYTGAIVGNNVSGKIINCTSSGRVTANQYAGGITGYNFSGGTIVNCVNRARVYATSYVGGIAAHSYSTNCTIHNCYNEGNVSVSSSTNNGSGAITSIGGNVTAQIAFNCYSLEGSCNVVTLDATKVPVTVLTAAEMGGQSAASPLLVEGVVYTSFLNMLNAGAYGYNNTSPAPAVAAMGWTQTTGEYPVLGIAAPASQPATDYTPNGTASAPYVISTLTELISYRDLINSSTGSSYRSAHYKVVADITLPSTNWLPIGNSTTNQFAGNFDGGNHLISNLYYNNANSSDFGLFGYIATSGVVRNFRVACNIIAAEDSIGAIAGNNYGTIINCISSGSIAALYQVGGITGTSTGNIINCANSAAVSSTTTSTVAAPSVGGIVGTINSSTIIRNCYNTGTISIANNKIYYGAIAGWVSTNVSAQAAFDCYYLTGSSSQPSPDTTIVPATAMSDANMNATTFSTTLNTTAATLRNTYASTFGPYIKNWVQVVGSYPTFMNN